MITREEADRLRDQLLGVLAEDARNTNILLSRLEAITRESGIGAHAALLLILTQIAFEDEAARGHWQAILAHREHMSGELRRDVGVRVALLDYFMNANRRLVQPSVIELQMVHAADRPQPQDPLTGLATERMFRASIQNELRRARRYGDKVSVVLFDVDGFARVNEAAGRIVADRLLKEAAILLSNKVRDIDLAARPGEDELALVLPETDRNGALLVAERYRQEFKAHFARREVAGRPARLSVSGGLASYPADATAPETLLERAAQALYRAKAAGKDNVQVYHPERRRYVRVDLDPGRFEVEVLSPREVEAGRARNLSRNGVVFGSPEALHVGEEIEIRLVGTAGGDATRSPRIRGCVVRLEDNPDPPADGTQTTGEAVWDRFEVGMAFNLDGADGEPDLLEFFEKARLGKVGSRS